MSDSRVVSVRFTNGEIEQMRGQLNGRSLSSYVRDRVLSESAIIAKLSEAVEFLTPPGKKLIWGDQDGQLFYVLIDRDVIDDQLRERKRGKRATTDHQTGP